MNTSREVALSFRQTAARDLFVQLKRIKMDIIKVLAGVRQTYIPS